MLDVVGLGFCSLDDLGVVPHLPRLDEGVPLLDVSRQGGGPVAQALVTLARLGATAGFVGRVGNDDVGDQIRAEMAVEGVDLSRVQVVPKATSARCIILIDQPSGKRSICASRGTAGDVPVAGLDLTYLCSGRVLHLDGHSRQAALVAARAARAAGVTVCLDAGHPDPTLTELVALTEVLIVGERFAAAIDADEQRAAAHLLTRGPRIVVITCGERGYVTRTADAEFSTPAFQVPVVDTTGAGDVFHGAYLFGLLQGWELETVAEFASATAALKCTQLGGRSGIPRFADVVGFLRERGHDVPAAGATGR